MFRFMVKFFKILGIACAIGILIRVGEVLLLKHNENNAEETQQVAEIINDNIVAENIKDNKEIIENIDVVIEHKETKQEEKVDVKEKKEAEQVVVPKTSKNTETEQKQEIKIETETKKEQVIKEKETIEEKKEEVVETKKEDTTIVKQEEIKQEVLAEEYKVNNQMINKIKEIIKNNETDDMKMYGYDVVVDNTIPNITNEFTFSEQRVINKLTLKFGTIRIYARDYYNNGVYISTQCFII